MASTPSQPVATHASAPPAEGKLARKPGLTGADMVGSVLRQLTDHIVAEDFEPGGVLPAEGELAKSYGVSRTVIREAMRSLRAQGLVEVSQGKPPRVNPPDSKATVASLDLLLRRNRATLLHLVEVRRPLECEIAALAAQRANDEHLRQLHRAIHDLAVAPSWRNALRRMCDSTGSWGKPRATRFLFCCWKLSRNSSANRGRRRWLIPGRSWPWPGIASILDAMRARDRPRPRASHEEHLQLADSGLGGL